MSIHRESRPALHQEGKRSFLSPAKLGTIFMASSGPRYKSSSLTLKMHVLFIKIYAFLPFLCAAESESLTSDTSLRHTIKGPLLWKSPPKEGEGDTLQFFPEPPPPFCFFLAEPHQLRHQACLKRRREHRSAGKPKLSLIANILCVPHPFLCVCLSPMMHDFADAEK